MAFASTDRQLSARLLNEAAYAARKVFGSDHPEFALVLQIMRMTDDLVDRIAPSVEVK